jgi:hypothetical protein
VWQELDRLVTAAVASGVANKSKYSSEVSQARSMSVRLGDAFKIQRDLAIAVRDREGDAIRTHLARARDQVRASLCFALR